MNEVIVSFLLGTSVGALLSFFGIMYYAKHMEKNKKEILIEISKDKWKTK